MDGWLSGGKRRERRGAARAHVYATCLARIAYARACICKRAAWGDGTTADRVHGVPRRRNKNKMNSTREQEEDEGEDRSGVAVRGKKGCRYF